MNNLFRTEEERTVVLTEKERENILKIDPTFLSIQKSVYFDNYDLPCPIKVEVLKIDNSTTNVVLRKSRHGNVKNEVRILQVLEEFGLPVPKVLVKPFENEAGEWDAVYSLLPGENLQKLSMHDEKSLAQAKVLLVEAVLKLRDATEFIKNHSVSEIIPEETLVHELDLLEKGNPWVHEDLYKKAVQEIKHQLVGASAPLILSNGGYQPGNFLAEDGKITGFLDFESVSFQDPLMGFVKYPIYDLRPLSRTDLIDNFLSKAGFTKDEFNIRLALGCLKILKKEVSVSGGDNEMHDYRNRLFNLLVEALPNIKGQVPTPYSR